MARQKSPFKLEGEIGDIIFFKTKDGGYMAREKTGVSADRVKNDPAFERTRENGAEFGRAGAASKVLRDAFRGLIQGRSDSRMVSRLTGEMVRVLRADQVNVRGQRNVIDGEVLLLGGFEFNQNGTLNRTLLAPYNAVIDRATGALTVTIPAFTVKKGIVAPEGATHFRFIAGGAEIDFEAEKYVAAEAASALMPLSVQDQPETALVTNVPAGSTKPLFLVFGVEFVQEINGQTYPLKTGQFNALALVEVDGGGD